MSFRVAGVIAVLLSLTTVLVDMGVSWYLEQSPLDGGLLGWLPELETVGQTAVVYLYVSKGVAFALSVLGIAALGYWLGLRLDLTAAYRSLLASFAIGGATGHLLGIVVFGELAYESFLGFSSASSIVVLLGPMLATGLQFALLGLAGAALAEFSVKSGARQKRVTAPDSDTQLDTE